MCRTFLCNLHILLILPACISEYMAAVEASATHLICHHLSSLPSILYQILHHLGKFQALFFNFPLKVVTLLS